MSGPTAFESQVRATLQQVLTLINKPQLTLPEATRAAALLQDLLSLHPEQPDALQLLGIIRRMQGQNREAEDLYRRSLKANPRQPFVHHNLGNLLATENRLDEAVEEQRAAIKQKQDYLEAHHALGSLYFRKGAFADAEKSYRNALKINSTYMPARQNLAAVLTELGRPQDAEIVLSRALAEKPADPRQVAALEHNLALALKTQRRYDEALKLFDAAQSKVPDMPRVEYNRANTLQLMGRMEDAVAAYQRAVAREPTDLVAHQDLNQTLYRLGRDEEFLRSYDQAMRQRPDIGELPMAKATFLFQREDFAGARELYEQAAKLLPDDVMPHDALGLIHARQGDFAAAVRAHETVLKMEPQNAQGWRNFAETLLRAGDAQRAREAAMKSLAIEPEHQGGLALLGTAYDMLGDERARALTNYETMVQAFEIEPPPGYSDIAAYNRDLDTFLNKLHVDKRENLDQTLRHGTQTVHNLFGEGHELIEQLRVQIDKAVATYISRMQPDARHPLLRRRGDGFAYSASWSARLHDQGFHTNHYHPKGWISSAYYVALPDAVTDADAERQGWIKFGEPHFDAGLKKPVRRAIRPRSGMLVLFPSYTWHGTVPFHSGQDRTTIAFDVMPR